MYEQLFTRQEEIFKVIASQKRLEIIQLLTHGELSVNQMVQMLGIPQANVSQHLSQLRQAGIAQTRRDGTTVYYRLTSPKIAEACSLIRQFLISQDGSVDLGMLQSEPGQLYPLVQDVVCGMRMPLSEVSEQAQYNAHPYYFCAGGCKDAFVAHPEDYIKSVES